MLIPPKDDPATEAAAPSSLSDPAAPPAGLSTAEQRKLAIAQGQGYVREAPPTVYQETGEEITLRGPNGEPLPCKYCGANPCSGPNWIFEGTSIFKCNSCGKKQKLGLTQELADKNKEEVEGYQRANTNRNRAWRDEDARREEERQERLKDMALNPNRPPLDPMFVSKEFFE